MKFDHQIKSNWLNRELFIKKLVSPFGLTLLSLISVFSGYLVAKDLVLFPIGFIVILIALIVIYFCLFQPLVGFYLFTFAAFFYFFLMRILGKVLPLSTGIELLVAIVFIGTLLIVKPKEKTASSLLKTGISITILLNGLFLTIEAFNPNVNSLQGWFPVFKRYIMCILVYITAYQLIDSPNKLKYFVKFWITLSFITALYGCYQQFFGLSNFELRFIFLQPGAFELMFQGGQLRKFSFLSDVASFGLLSGAMAVFTLIIAINEKRVKIKYLLFFFALIMELGMAYSGTRTATIMLPCGLALYGIITIQNKATVFALFSAFIIMMFVLFIPIYSNLTLNRIRSTFNSKDESLNLRDKNREYIQPYIYQHPIGGGVATTGLEGVAFYPEHPLAGFPPDSGLLKLALELGWIGISINLLFYLMIFYQGIFYYFRMRRAEFKLYTVAILSTLFATIVAQYSQMSIGQFPMIIFIFSSLSLLKRLKEFDEKIDYHFYTMNN